MSGRFVKGQSGNPSGRPRVRRPHNSAFDVIFDKMLTATQNGVERELSIDEALELQTYQSALKGNRMAVRSVLKMIEKREAALRKMAPAAVSKVNPVAVEYSSNSADEAMKLLNILCSNLEFAGPDSSRPFVIETWAAQVAISRPGRTKLSARERDDLKLFIKDYAQLRWPRGQKGD